MQEQEWIRNEYSARMYDKADKLNTEAHRHRNGCHPKERGSGLDDSCPRKIKSAFNYFRLSRLAIAERRT